tara:strand:- start:68 stop:1078 length:1011 start_codon:yes stop_codon:yes gene_type:complete
MKSKSILVMRFSSIGDIIQTTSTLTTIKKYLPNSSIDYLTLDHFKTILKDHKSINKIYSTPKDAKYSNIINLILKLKSNKYDYIVDLHSSLRSKVFSYLLKRSKIKKIRKPRLKRFFLFLFHFNTFKKNFNVRLMYNQALQDLLPANYKIENTKLYISSAEKKEINEKLNIEKYYVLAPEAAWKQKQFSAQRYVGILKNIYKKFNLTPVLIGSSNGNICKEITKGYNNEIINISGKTSLRESLSVISNALFVIGGDTGMIHAAEALSRHVVGIFGPTNIQTGGGLFNNLSKEIHSPNIWCKPCSINGSFPCYRKKQYCMTEINDEEILRAINNIYG